MQWITGACHPNLPLGLKNAFPQLEYFSQAAAAVSSLELLWLRRSFYPQAHPFPSVVFLVWLRQYLQTWSPCSSSGQFWRAIIIWYCPIELAEPFVEIASHLCTESIFLSVLSSLVVPRTLLDKISSYLPPYKNLLFRDSNLSPQRNWTCVSLDILHSEGHVSIM